VIGTSSEAPESTRKSPPLRSFTTTMEHARLKRVMREIAACEKEADDEIAVKMIDGAQMCIFLTVRLAVPPARYISWPGPLTV